MEKKIHQKKTFLSRNQKENQLKFKISQATVLVDHKSAAFQVGFLKHV